MSLQRVVYQIRRRIFFRERLNFSIIVVFLFCHLISWLYYFRNSNADPRHLKNIIFLELVLFLGNSGLAFYLWQENMKRISRLILISTLFFEIILSVVVVFHKF